MQDVIVAAAIPAAYVLGSVPFGLLVVRVATGQDIRQLHSGRTGGTNAARAAGVWAGIITGLADLLKGAAAVWLARGLSGDRPWVEAAAGLMAVIGHNYSVFMLERVQGRLRWRGGAGGAPTMGATLALWAPSALFILPVAMLVLYFAGYASLSTLSIGLMSMLTLAWRAAIGQSPWAYAAFALAAMIALVWALRPNIRRLLAGRERVVGWRARRQAAALPVQPDDERDEKPRF